MTVDPANKFLSKFRHRLLAPRPRRIKLPPAVRIILGLAMLVVAGTLLLMLPGVTTEPLSFMDLFFTSVSAVTVTGLTVTPTSTSFTLFGQIILLILIQAGGLGFMAMVVLAIRALGGRLSLLDRLALTSSLGLERQAEVLLLLRQGLIFMLVVEGVGTVLLAYHWSATGTVTGSQAIFYGLFHAVSAFCNAGFDLFAGLPQYPTGIPDDSTSLLIMGVLVVLGGLGGPVIIDLITRGYRKRLTLHTRVTLVTVIALTLIGWTGLFISEYWLGGVLGEHSLGSSLVTTWFQSVSTRTAGFPGLNEFNFMQQESRLLVMALMFIGSAPSSMGGGITTGTLAVLMATAYSFSRGLPQTQVGNRTLPKGTVRRAGVVLVVSLAIILVATWLLLASNDTPMSVGLFEVVSAFATCGLSLGLTSSLDVTGRVIIMAMMFWGRVGALTIVLAILHRQTPEQLLQYPEETVLIG